MDREYIIDQLKQNQSVFAGLMTVSSTEEAYYKPHENHWCLLEIVCHLVDEEVLDFRTRVRTALQPDRFDFVPIDPVSWVTRHDYINQDYTTKVAQWMTEREKSITWLQSIKEMNWDSQLLHAELGPMTANRLLANWLAHDYIHIRQILRVKHAILGRNSEQDLTYAGNW